MSIIMVDFSMQDVLKRLPPEQHCVQPDRRHRHNPNYIHIKLIE
jgi:hypothetical protein